MASLLGMETKGTTILNGFYTAIWPDILGTTANWVFSQFKKIKQEKLEHFQENEESHEQASF